MRASRVLSVLVATTLIGVACGDDPAGIPAGLEVFTADLNGANERPNPVTTSARGRAIVTIMDSLISWKVEITSPIDNITAGHIHHGGPNDAGPFRVNFTPPASGPGFTGTATVGSVTVQGDSIQTWIRGGEAYVNIHTSANGGGEIRGQLRRP